VPAGAPDNVCCLVSPFERYRVACLRGRQAQTHARTHTHAVTHGHTHTHTCTYTHARTCTRTYAHTHARTHAHAHAHVHAHAHTHKHTHKQMHIRTHARIACTWRVYAAPAQHMHDRTRATAGHLLGGPAWPRRGVDACPARRRQQLRGAAGPASGGSAVRAGLVRAGAAGAMRLDAVPEL